MREYDLEERLIDFAVRIIRIAESLPKSKVGNHIAGQLYAVDLHLLRIMVKRKAQSPDLILSTK